MVIRLRIQIGAIQRGIVMKVPSKQSCPSNTLSPEKNVASPINPDFGICSHLFCIDDSVTARPATTVTNPRYSYAAQPPRRNSSYSAYTGMQTPAGPSGRDRQDYRDNKERARERDTRERDLPIPPGRDYPRENQVYRRDSTNGGNGNGESSGESSYNNNHFPEHYQPPLVSYPTQQQQEFSPPSTPPHGQQFASTSSPQYHFPASANQQYQSYGLPSPEPEDFRAAPKVPAHQFTRRPATPPVSDVADSPAKKKEKRMSKLKRFSAFGKIIS